MQTVLWKRIIVLVIIGLALLVPMGMIMGLIGERQNLQREVIREIAGSSTGEQAVTGPVLVIPYLRKVTETRTVKDSMGFESDKEFVRHVWDQLTFLPEKLDISGVLTTFTKNRGIYTARLYTTPLAVAGRFEVPADYRSAAKADVAEWGAARIVIGVADPRGIRNAPVLNLNGGEIGVRSGGDAPGMNSGVYADLGVLAAGAAQRLEFQLNLELTGMQKLWFVPTGKQTQVKIASSWQHPSFYGRYLPEPKGENEAAGFPATWRTSQFSTNIGKSYAECVNASDKCQAFQQNGFGVSLIQPADVYQQLERSAKYAVLFIGLTLIAFFAFELFKQLNIHPIQYLLVGAALAMFYLLLTALSEHLIFAHAYAIASGACVGLIGFYVSYVLQSLWRGGSFAAMLAALYATLYALLKSEDYALVLGTMFLFVVLTVIMFTTRRTNWYRVGEGTHR